MTTYLMPLEPIEDRYTAQWYEWFPQEASKHRDEVVVIDGEEFNHELEGEFFLDPIGTHYYKFSQLKELMTHADEWEDGDEIFFFDVWFPGMESIAYIRDMLDIDVKITGVLHAGTYDPHDLTAQRGMTSWAKKIENGWFEFLDTVYVGTEFHKGLVSFNRHINPDQIEVTGLPLDMDKLRSMRTDETEERIVFTGRLSEEKGVDVIRQLQDEGYPIHATMDYDHSKEEYYELLANSMAVIAPSQQETFGYGILEGLALDCEPIVPDRLAFRDTVPKQYRYNDLPMLKNRLDSILEGFNPPSEEMDYYESHLDHYHYTLVIERMFKE